MKYKKYKLKKDMPMLKAGVIFEHLEYSALRPDLGNMVHGVMILSWGNDGDTQNSWCAETFIMPGQLAKNTEWFEEIMSPNRFEELQKIICELKDAVTKLANIE